jgi:hypothetical protein
VATLRQTVSSAHSSTTQLLSLHSQLREQGVTIEDLDDESKKPLLDIETGVRESAELLLRLCTELDERRIGWWDSKSEMRKTWLDTGDGKLTEVNKINNNVTDMIRDMRQRVGQFCKYTLSVSAEDLEYGPKEDINTE